jgi:exopolyphosphatase/guanosine-5'-triphosphate,3'-diphosphate pyrophosphatase
MGRPPTTRAQPQKASDDELLMAAADLGSNSFHLLLARYSRGRIEIIDRLREAVRLRSGLGLDGCLAADARGRALACLERFGRRLQGVTPGRVRAVATATLRRASDARAFLGEAETALGYRIEIISGEEEARLIYRGALSEGGPDGRRRLVLDIGGGSTELVLGRDLRPERLHSLGVGCVSLTEACFPGNRMSRRHYHDAVALARYELARVTAGYRESDWDLALGASGTIRSICELCLRRGWTATAEIDSQGLERVREAMLSLGRLDPAAFPELAADRVLILPGGVAILEAVFRSLAVTRMHIAPGALREGLLAEMTDVSGGGHAG